MDQIELHKTKVRRFRFVKILVVGLALLGVGTWYGWPKVVHHTTSNKEQYTLLNSSDIVTVKSGTVSEVLSITGDLAPLNQTVISSDLNSHIKQVKVDEGQFVTQGQVLALIDNSELVDVLGEQRAIVNSTQAKFNLDKQKLERQKRLYEKGFVSKAGYDELVANYNIAAEAINEKRVGLQRVQKQLASTIVKAPFSGYVYKKFIDAGQLVSKNDKLFSLANLDLMQIKSSIPSEEISQIKVGQKVQFTVETSSESYLSTITAINPVSEVGTRSYYVYINFANKKAKLKSGQFIKGWIEINSLKNIAYLPSECIHTSTDGSSYVLLLSNNKIIAQAVRVLINNSIINISGVAGVPVGAQIMAANIQTVKPGLSVKIQQ